MLRFLRTPLPLLLSLAIVLASAACGSKAMSPSGPSALDTTATISGTVQSGVSAAGVSVAGHDASGIHVSVVGTAVSSTTDSSGRFVLSAVPAGQALTLRFEAPGLDASLSLSGLVPGQTLSITVQLSGGHAVLAGSGDSASPSPSPSPAPSPIASPSPSPSPEPHHGHEDEVEFRGSVEAINPPNLTVAGRLVQTDSSTEFKRQGDRIGLADLKVQDVVEVDGTAQADGSVLATKIEVESKPQGNDDDDSDDN